MINCYGSASVRPCITLLVDWIADCPGASLFLAARGIATDLRRVHDLTEIKHIEKEDKMISEGTEDGLWYHFATANTLQANGAPALKLDTLLKLSESTSHDLRAAYVASSLHRKRHI